jgi:hypothetical protein
MGRLGGLAAFVLATAVLASWAGGASPRAASGSIPRDYPDSFLPLPDRFDTPANQATDAKIALGRTLFWKGWWRT